MNKELEALKRIRNVEVCIGNDLNTAVKMFDIDHEYDKAFEIIEKELKALEIIKKKGIDIAILIWSNNCGEYNANARLGVGFTQEEYDLLNKVLL